MAQKNAFFVTEKNKNRVLFCFALLLLISFFMSTDVLAQTDDTAWPMFRQNPQHTGLRKNGSEDNEPQNVRLKYPPIDTGIGFITDITSSPSIDGSGNVFIGSLGKNFFAIDPDKGQIIGTFTTFNSVVSSPAIGENGNIFIGSWDGTVYELNFDASKGKDDRWSLENFYQANAEDFGHFSGTLQSGAVISMSGPVGVGISGDADGDFFVDNLPIGNYSGAVVHETLCERKISLDICGFQHEVGPVNIVLSSKELVDGELVCPEQSAINLVGCVGLICTNEPTFIDPLAFPMQKPDLDKILALNSHNRNLLVERGISGSPLIGFNNWVYWGSQNGRFYGWDLDSKCIFFKDLGSPIISSAAQSLDGTVYVITQAGALYSFNPDFSFKFLSPFLAGGEVKSSPAIGIDGTIYFGSLDNNLYAVQPDGLLKWTFPTEGIVVSSPAVDSDGVIYFGSGDGKLYAVEDRGVGPRLKWEFLAGAEIAGSSVSIGKDGTLYIGVGGEFSKILAVTKDGASKWCIDTENGVTSTVAIADDGTLIVGSFDGKVYAMENDERPGTFTVSGKIVEVSPGRNVPDKPIAGALVQMSKLFEDDIKCGIPFFGSATSSRQQENLGAYEIKDVISGDYKVTVFREDFDKFEKEITIDRDLINENIEIESIAEENKEEITASFIKEEEPGACLPLRVKFTSTSIIKPPDLTVSYFWDFGDGGTSDQKDPVYEYRIANEIPYTAKLTVQGPGDVSGSSEDSVFVTEPPCARFAPGVSKTKRVEWGERVSFTDLSVPSAGQPIDRWEWEFSFNRKLSRLFRKNRSDKQHPVHTFKGYGTHTVKLHVRQADGGEDDVFGEIVVVPNLSD